MNDEKWLALVDAFNAAAVSAGSWLDALSALAHATGSRSGQLVGLGSPNALPFNWVSDLDPRWGEDFFSHGGSDPQRNPSIRAAATSRVLDVVSSAQFVSVEERRRNEFIQWSEREHDLSRICLTPIIKDADTHVGLAVMRSVGQGEIEPYQRAVFASIAPHVRAAVRTQIALENQGAVLIAGAMEALALTVFVCDAAATVKAMTPSAEALLSAGGALRLRNRKLGAALAAESRALSQAITHATQDLTRPGAPASSTVIVRDLTLEPLVLEIVPLSRRELSMGFEPRALVIARVQRPKPSSGKEILRTVYALTQAEAEVALLLAEGQAPEAIAENRRVKVSTIRVQIRGIYAKLNVRRLSELAARIQSFR